MLLNLIYLLSRVYLTSLRKKIEKKSHEKYIQTHIGVGYKMVRVTSTEEE